MLIDSDVRCVADVHAVLGEGPVWVAREQALYWVDIKGYRIFRLDESGTTEWAPPLRVCSLVPRASIGFIGGTDAGIALIDPDAKRYEIIANPEDHLPHNRFNDGKADRQGRFWAGTMDDLEKDATGTLYRVDPDLGCSTIDTGYRITNGPAFSPDGRIMYHNDTARQVTYAFDLREDGHASNRRVFLQFGPGDGNPDGMTVDAEGCLWIAFWGGSCVRRFSPDGGRLETVRLPVSQPSSCAFGGPDLDRLYVTSAKVGLDEESLKMQPNAGGLFMFTPGVRGLEEVPFAG
jgi:xylono-1,5-lactonase